MKNRIFQELAQAASKGEPVALGIISGVKGSSPQKVGAKAIFYSDGRIKGTMGGGCLEAEIQQRAIQSLRTDKASTFDLLLDHDFGWDDGLICGGKVFGVILPNAQNAGEKFWGELAERNSTLTWGVKQDFSIAADPSPAAHSSTHPPIHSSTPHPHSPTPPLHHSTSAWLYQETVTPPCALWIAGAGHIAQAVAPLALQLDFTVTVFDDRPALANHQYFAPEVVLKAEVWEKLLTLPLPDVPSFGLIVTRGHRHDALVLKDWIHKPFLFLGMIGSSRKARTIFEHFREEKIATEEELKRVVCPVGIKIRSQSVAEIGVSIMAQFIEKRAELVYEKRVDRACASHDTAELKQGAHLSNT
jgi:xanthine dehydrogenase accessory factor